MFFVISFKKFTLKQVHKMKSDNHMSDGILIFFCHIENSALLGIACNSPAQFGIWSAEFLLIQSNKLHSLVYLENYVQYFSILQK